MAKLSSKNVRMSIRISQKTFERIEQLKKGYLKRSGLKFVSSSTVVELLVMQQFN